MRVGSDLLRQAKTLQVLRRRQKWRQQLRWLICIGLCTLFVFLSAQIKAATQEPTVKLPALQVHPLPSFFLQGQDNQQHDNYFSQVKPAEVGYLIWSKFPVQIYIAPPIATTTHTHQNWEPSIAQAIKEWQVYFPLEITIDPKKADIKIEPTNPKGASGRVRSGETAYQIYIDQQGILSHRCTVTIRPSQTAAYITAAARHELGHALGIWGHSPVATDSLYFSQVRQPAPISVRDVNTLKQVYLQPTRLGWPMIPVSPLVPTVSQSDR